MKNAFANFRQSLKPLMRKIYLLLLTLYTLSVAAQNTVPHTEIYLIPITNDKGNITFGEGIKVNAPGHYSNQPLFSNNAKKLYFSCISDSFKAEVYECDLKKFEVKPFIIAPQTAEYSLQYTPDLKSFSMVRVEADDKTQTLYTYNPKTKEFKAISPKDMQVGYYCWVNAQTVMLFLLKGENEFELIRYSLGNGESKSIDKQPGRSIWRNPQDGNIYYVRKGSDFTLMQYNPANELPGEFDKMPDGVEDFTITAKGDFLCGVQGKLMKLDVVNNEWKVWADFTGKPYEKFYRLALSPDGQWLALVVYTHEKP
jgi:hypothetical protein